MIQPELPPSLVNTVMLLCITSYTTPGVISRNPYSMVPRILHLPPFCRSLFNCFSNCAGSLCHRSMKHQRTYLSTSSTAAAASTTSRYIVHASGLDRLWIVNDVAEKVIESGGNVAESKAAKLGQYFSLMMLVEVHGGDKGGCADEMRSLLSSLPDLNVAVFEAQETTASVPSVACTSVLTPWFLAVDVRCRNLKSNPLARPTNCFY
jgi:predicted amino acid-binding ACT domain protein